MNSDRIRLLIVDDHPLFLDGLRTLFSATNDIEVLGEASCGEDAVERAAELQPDVILMDVQMPGMNGIEATRRIAHHQPGARVLMLTMFDDDPSVFAAMRAGSRGYVLKGARHEELLRAVRAVASGEAIFGPSVAARMMEYFQNLQPAELPRAFPELSEREREVLHLIAQGKRNLEIARDLRLSEKTVRNHVSNIFAKLQVADRAQAIVRARDAGIGMS